MSPIATTSNLSITQGFAVAYFAFDIGYEVNLDKLKQSQEAHPVQPISRTKKTPSYLQYAKPPQVIALGEVRLFEQITATVSATVFDFGAASISFRCSLLSDNTSLPLHKLPQFSRDLFESNIESIAWEQANALMERIKHAIKRPALSSMMEDYYVFVIEQTNETLSAAQWLEQQKATLAQVMRFEIEPLSAEQQREVTSKPISYYENDLAVIDWNATVLVDTDYSDTLNVLELMNVEFLEARYIDAELDKRLEVYESIAQRQPRWTLPLLNPYRQTIQELATLRIEAALLSERVENALKLIGDLYLARIHTAVTERFNLAAWDEAISRKLDIIGNLYQIMTDRINNRQGQTLELIIILLILIEIMMNLKLVH